MLKKTITYEDFNGVERTEDFYFNFTQAEIADMELGTAGGLSEMIQRIVSAQDIPAIVNVFKELVLKAYGVKSPDGKRFMKKDANGRPLSAEFEETNAYSQLYMELASDAKKASEFVNAIVPSVPSTPAIIVPVT